MIKELKEKNIKQTTQRIKIYQTLKKPTTVKSLLEYCKDIDQSTIYRVIELFLQKEIITKEVRDNEIYYSLIKNDHFHFVECDICHKKEMLKVCPIKIVKGYEITSHNIEIHGICNDCKKNSN
ncbi:MAG: transcriptional repressor [Bacilli bacterium]